MVCTFTSNVTLLSCWGCLQSKGKAHLVTAWAPRAGCRSVTMTEPCVHSGMQGQSLVSTVECNDRALCPQWNAVTEPFVHSGMWWQSLLSTVECGDRALCPQWNAVTEPFVPSGMRWQSLVSAVQGRCMGVAADADLVKSYLCFESIAWVWNNWFAILSADRKITITLISFKFSDKDGVGMDLKPPFWSICREVCGPYHLQGLCSGLELLQYPVHTLELASWLKRSHQTMICLALEQKYLSENSHCLINLWFQNNQPDSVWLSPFKKC